MRVKTFQGRTLEEVLPQIREDLGPDAVVLSQRPLISGGVGGFFGKRMVEVTAADRMPNDEELVDLEQQFTEANGGTQDPAPNQDGPTRGRPAASSGGRSQLPAGIDIVDDWDPSADAELAAEFGDVLRRVRDASPEAPTAPAVASGEQSPKTSGSTYEPLALPRRQATVEQPQPVAQAPLNVDTPVTYSPAGIATSSLPPVEDAVDEQARRLAARAHQAIAAATREIERQLATSEQESRRPTAAPVGATSTFRAEVVPTQSGPRVGFPQPAHAAATDLYGTAGALAQHAVPALDPVYEGEPLPTPAAPSASHPAAPVSPGPSLVESSRGQAAELADMLVHAGVERDVADAVVRTALLHRLPFVAHSDLRKLLREVVAENVPVSTGWAPLGRPHRIAFVGPSGAGKSSVAAKLAEGYQRGVGMRVAVISVLAGVHAHPPAHAHDPLLAHPGIDLQFAADVDQMLTALRRVQDRELVIIDTPSAAYLDRAAATSVAACLAVAKVDEVHAVIPLATSLREAESIIDHFRTLSVNRLVVSKLDESRYAGQLLNFGYRLGLPITYLSDGPGIPEDLRAAASEEIAALIVPEGDGPEPFDDSARTRRKN